MKLLFTIATILFLSVTAIAQNATVADLISLESTTTTTVTVQEVKEHITTATAITRLYRYENSRILKALTFKTKLDNPKLT